MSRRTVRSGLSFSSLFTLVLFIVVGIVGSSVDSSSETSSITIRSLVLPRGSYTLRISWGERVIEQVIESRGDPITIRIPIRARNIRQPLNITIRGENKTIFEVFLETIPFGYKIAQLKLDPDLKFIDRRAIWISELVTVVNTTIEYIPTKSVSIRSVLLNGYAPENVRVMPNRITISEFVVDDLVLVEILFDEGIINAEFKMGLAEAVQVAGKFIGPFKNVKISYVYSIKNITWFIELPISQSINSSIIYSEPGFIMSAKNVVENPIYETSEVEEQLTTTNTTAQTTATSGEIMDRSSTIIDRVAEIIQRFKGELMILAGILIVAGLIRRSIIPLIFGIMLVMLILLM